MTQEDKKWLSIKNEMVLRMSNKAIGMGELEKFFSFVNELMSNKNSLEQQNKELIEKYSQLSDKYNNTSDLVVELRQQNTALQLSNSNLSKILDEATYSLRCEELKVEQLQARIKELEDPKTCDGCYYYDKYEYFEYCDGCVRHSDAGSFATLKDKFTKKQSQ